MLGLGPGDLLFIAVVAAVLVGKREEKQIREKRGTKKFDGQMRNGKNDDEDDVALKPPNKKKSSLSIQAPTTSPRSPESQGVPRDEQPP